MHLRGGRTIAPGGAALVLREFGRLGHVQQVGSNGGGLSLGLKDVRRHPMTRRRWTMLGQTEVVENNLSPVFVKAIPMRYYFEERQQVPECS